MAMLPTTTVNVQGIPTHTLILGESGENLPILLLHGWGAHIDLLRPLAVRLAAHGYQVYALDMPGFGQTPEPPQAWTVFDYADFVLAFMDAHGLDKVYLFGHSFGGRLGLILGSEHAARFEKIVLADAAGIRPKSPLLKQMRLKTYKAVRDGLRAVGLRALSENLREWYNGRYGSSDFNAVSGVMRDTFVKVVNQDLLDYAKRVTRPTLLLWGDQDEDTPLWQAKTLEKAIPDAGLVVFEGAGHYSYLDNLTESARVMDYFFKH